MTIRTFTWYQVLDSRQFCQVTGIASTADPQIQVASGDERLAGFHVYLVWFTPADEHCRQWTKRAILMEMPKATRLLRDPSRENAPLVESLKSLAKDIPFTSLGVDGQKTEPFARS